MDIELLNQCETKAVELARIAGEMMTSYCGKSSVVTKSNWVDLVTETDHAVEKMVFDELKKEFPDHKFIGEESADKYVTFTDEPTWICDPIDGTTNFVHTFPYCCISLAFAWRKDIQFGLVYNPFSGRMYTAKRGFGAFHNGKPIHVRPCENLSKALCIAEYGSHRREDQLTTLMGNICAIVKKAHGIRSLGSAALNMCMVAHGFADCHVEYGLRCWDMAAASLIVTEAGGYMYDPTGGEFDLFGRRLLASGQQNIAKEVIETLIGHIDNERDVK